MKKKSVIAIIPAFNEEDLIEQCIQSLRFCDEVVVLWNGSDETGTRAKKAGARVIKCSSTAAHDFTAVQKNINEFIQTTTAEWLLRVDADEVATPELAREIHSILHNPELNNPVAYGIPRKQFFFGGFLTGGDWAYDRLVRLFRPKYCSYDPIVPVHEQFSVQGSIGYLTSPLLHYSHPTLEVAFEKFNRYTSAEVATIHDSYATAVIKLFFLPPYIFMRWMLWHHGWKDGLRGIVAGLCRALYDFMVYSKYLESLTLRKSRSHAL